MGRLLIVSTMILVVAFLLTAQFSRAPDVRPEIAAQVLAVIALVAVGIERAIEGMWTIVESVTTNPWWPLHLAGEFDKLKDSLNKDLTTVFKHVDDRLKELIDASELVEDKAELARAKLVELNSSIMELNYLTNSVSSMNSVVSKAREVITDIEKAYPKIEGITESATRAVQSASDFVATFKGNPGRRLISLYLGAILGMLVSGLFGLDMFQTVLGTTVRSSGLFPYWGVAVTGLVMGLGANPTHEVIRILEEVKESRKKANVPSP